jgi:hypothetical protein
MRRLCISLVMVSSLLVAAVPAQASASTSHRHKARGDAVRAHAKSSPVAHTTKYTWGRT